MRYAICDFCGKKIEIRSDESENTIKSLRFFHLDSFSQEAKEVLADLNKSDVCDSCYTELMSFFKKKMIPEVKTVIRSMVKIFVNTNWSINTQGGYHV